MTYNPSRGPLASTVTHHIEYSGGNFQLFQVKSVSTTDNGTGELVQGGSGVMGATFSDGGFTGTLETHRQISLPDEVLWEVLRNKRERFIYSLQDTGGARRTFADCQVIKVDVPGPSDGQQTMTIEFLAPEKTLTLPVAGA